ncbi:peptidoglycan-binding domain-containing protein [Bradyrhizobium sp. BR 1432]|uniref:peptidoglycan-binding domain-containing protein n=1 Tax=Bradyrhizobium sp. BR 1432 TaxID=3447966 RepID=UPI003EE51542
MPRCARSAPAWRGASWRACLARLWPKTSGLYARREAEARLFVGGLAAHHPKAHAKLEVTPPAPDPDIVIQIQARLRELGYYDAGRVDGQLVPKGRTEATILAFRPEHGLPLVPAISDEGHQPRSRRPKARAARRQWRRHSLRG